MLGKTLLVYVVRGDSASRTDTFFARLHHLPPGHWVSVNLDNGQSSIPQLWFELNIKGRAGWRFDDAVEQVREQFLQNIRLHLRSDLPVGAARSGGIYSSAVLCAIRFVEPDLPIHPFSHIASVSALNVQQW